METIRTLRPNVTQNEAIACFQRNTVGARVHSLLRGPLRSVAPFYIPFHLYQVEMHNRGTRQSQLMAVDAVSGGFDPYSFEQDFRAEDLVQVVTRNRPVITISREAGEALIVEKVRRVIFHNGFFRLQDLEIHAKFVPILLHIPYWVGFFGRGSYARVEVLDAVRRRVEGARVKSCVREWLQS